MSASDPSCPVSSGESSFFSEQPAEENAAGMMTPGDAQEGRKRVASAAFVHLAPHLLRSVEKPARYLGGEWNSVRKAEPAEGPGLIHFAFCFPDLYEVGMSNLALHILYGLLNEIADVFCERVFAPDFDMREAMRREKLPLFALETGRILAAFDLIGFTLQYEMSYATIVAMLQDGGVPIWQKDRTEADPFVICGGPVVANAEPVAPFFDLMMIGEGEEVLPKLIDIYRRWRAAGEPRQRFLEEAGQLEGVYVPSFYAPRYDTAGHFKSLDVIHPGAPHRIRKQIIRDLDKSYVPLHTLVPNIAIVHDRIFLELYRGCGNGCRFCQAGMIYRPVRERKYQTLLEQAEAMYWSSGYEEIGLLSLSTGDYSQLEDLTSALVERFAPRHVNLSLPSLRLDSVSLELLERASTTRRSGLTFAPEAGSQRVRDVINKNIQESDLIEAARFAFARGWDRLKLYFMIGHPGESDEDVLGIADLARKLIELWKGANTGQPRRRLHLSISVAFFIPKPWTPFQWMGQISREEMRRRIGLLQQALRHPAIELSWADPEDSEVEAMLAKGDRRMAKAIAAVVAAGGYLEGERRGFSYERWQEAFAAAGLNVTEIAHQDIPETAPLAWDFWELGVRKDFLRAERQRAQGAQTSVSCRQGCRACGAWRFAAGICPPPEKMAKVAQMEKTQEEPWTGTK